MRRKIGKPVRRLFEIASVSALKIVAAGGLFVECVAPAARRPGYAVPGPCELRGCRGHRAARGLAVVSEPARAVYGRD
jgi:hypothetical protein